jgi:nitrate/nitrite transporter NarK
MTKTKIALAAALIISTASAALAGDSDSAEKWYPQTAQEIQQARHGAGNFGAAAYDFVSPTHHSNSRVKSQRD